MHKTNQALSPSAAMTAITQVTAIASHAASINHVVGGTGDGAWR
jgi:hypothetical protein